MGDACANSAAGSIPLIYHWMAVFISPSAVGVLQEIRLILTQGSSWSGRGERRGDGPRTAHAGHQLGRSTHMRNFRPAVDDHSPATDTSVYSDALGSLACGDEADGLLC